MSIGRSSAPDHDRAAPAGPAPGAAAEPEPVAPVDGPPPGGPAELPEPGAAAEESVPEESVGAALARAREAAGLTPEQVSEATRVRTPLVEAIERDDFSVCGGDVYARGHIRSLAHAVGADGEALIARYEAVHGAPETAAPTQIFETERIRTDRRRPNWAGAMVAAIVVVVAFVAVSLFTGRGGGGESGATSGDVAQGSPRTSASHSGRPSAPPPSASPSGGAVAGAPADRVTVRLTAEQGRRAWVQVTDGSGETVYQQVLKAGQSKTFTDERKLKVLLGDAGAVRLDVNGKSLGTGGQDGRIRRLSFTRGDPTLG